MIYSKMKKIDDIFNLLSFANPKRITFDLSEDGTFYNVKIYFNVIDKLNDKKYESYIECKTSLNSITSCPLVYNHKDRNAEIFTITIPDMDE